jgi:hypothetical protein
MEEPESKASDAEAYDAEASDDEIIELTGQVEDNEPAASPFSLPQVFPENIWEQNWSDFYSSCPTWKKLWQDTHSSDIVWLVNVKVFSERMFFEGRLCIPTQLQEKIILEHHIFLAHIGGQKFWKYLSKQFIFAQPSEAKKYAMAATKHCPTCEACIRPQSLRTPISFSIVPPHLMHSVALDRFHMPVGKVEGQIFDIIAVCVDRLSGWVVAVPGQNKGLTGAKVAKAMLKNQWRPFGIPSIISTDQGSHFTGEWWKTMCAVLGIRQAYSQAYHHQANGRAEMAGRILLKKLRKIWIHNKINWVEALPAILDRNHDTPGESGLTPYQILFGRDRPLANLPYPPPRECEDAKQFFKRMKFIDESVSKALNDLHAKRVEKINENRQNPKPFQVGDVVYYRRPEGSGTKLDTRWLGPAKTVAREGSQSYLIQIRKMSR